jgi:phage terminase large subunit
MAIDIRESLIRRAAYRKRIDSLGEAGQAAELLLCRQRIDHWINHWVLTFDPREGGVLPFDLFAKQLEFLAWLQEREQCQEYGLVEKSRDQGATWLSCAYATHGLLFRPGFTAGFGSLKREEVDEIGNINTILEKCRFILHNIPQRWMLPKSFRHREHASLFRIVNKKNDSIITGEGGDDMGRGGRSSIFFVDEAARLPRSQLVEAALSQTTRCRIDISTPNGVGNAFYRKRFGGHVKVFILDWHDDPRKDQAWYAEQCKRFDAVTVAQEIDRDYSASIEGIAIPALWVRAAIDLIPRAEAHGPIVVGFDVAEEGKDLSVVIARQGPMVHEPTQWGQVNTTEGAWRAREFAAKQGASEVVYDSGGAGAGIKGTWDSSETPLGFLVTPVNFGGEATLNVWPDGRTAKEKFRNLRAEMWWNLRARFERAFEFREKGISHPFEDMISIPNHPQLIAELSSVLVEHTETGKIQLESKKAMKNRGVKSPDYGDALALAFHVGTRKIPFQWW